MTEMTMEEADKQAKLFKEIQGHIAELTGSEVAAMMTLDPTQAIEMLKKAYEAAKKVCGYLNGPGTDVPALLEKIGK